MPDNLLNHEIQNTIDIYEQIIGHTASRTRQMISSLGPIEALSKLVVSSNLQQGFRALRDQERLDLSFEAIVTRHPNLFNQKTIDVAQWRLDHKDQLL